MVVDIHVNPFCCLVIVSLMIWGIRWAWRNRKT